MELSFEDYFILRFKLKIPSFTLANTVLKEKIADMKQVFIFIILTTLLSCSTEDESKICELTSEWEIVEEEVALTSCYHFEIYEYKGKLYSLCNCCICDKLAIPTNCEGESLCGACNSGSWCDELSDCLSDFNTEATFLYYMIEE